MSDNSKVAVVDNIPLEERNRVYNSPQKKNKRIIDNIPAEEMKKIKQKAE